MLASNQIDQAISAAVFDLARKIISEQSSVPMSPARQTKDGRIELCAAAALVSAGLELSGHDDERAEFEEQAAVTSDRKVVRSAFRKLGWPDHFCTFSMGINDAAPAAIRRDAVLTFMGINREASL